MLMPIAGKKLRQGDCCEEAGSQAAADVGLGRRTLRAAVTNRSQYLFNGRDSLIG